MSTIAPDNLERVADAALSLAGLSARLDPTRYLAALAPGETPDMGRSILHMSGCGFAAGAALRRAGYAGAELAAPYVVGSAVSRVVGLARAHGAWRTSAPLVRGAVFLIGGPGGGGPEHMAIVVGVRPAGPGVFDLTVVQGGQTDEHGAQVTNRQIRRLSVAPGAWAVDGRAGVGWVDASALELGGGGGGGLELAALAVLVVGVAWALS